MENFLLTNYIREFLIVIVILPYHIDEILSLRYLKLECNTFCDINYFYEELPAYECLQASSFNLYFKCFGMFDPNVTL